MPDPAGPHRRSGDGVALALSRASTEVRIGDGARGLRRSIGPAAWMVLEELLLASAARQHGPVVAEVSVRDLAGLTGLGKDAVARALRRLLAASVVVRSFEERGECGAFGRVRYQLRVERLSGVKLESPSHRATPPKASSSSPRQAALFELDGDGA